MDNVMDQKRNGHVGENAASLYTDLKSLFKGLVLILNILPVFTGFWLALYFTDTTLAGNWGLFSLTMIGSTLVMAGALTLNNWYDVDIDTVMDRTKQRPTVTGSFSLKAVLTLGIVLSVLGFIMLAFTTLEATVYALIGWVTYVVLYTMWTKRKYTLNTVIGSVSGAVTPLIGWAAIDSAYHIVPIMLFAIIFVWQMPHTFSIAMRRFDEYKAANVAMLPVVYGFPFTKRQMAVYVICLLPMPFLLTDLGMAFVVVASVLNIGWIIFSLIGFFMKDDYKWANMMFFYSLNYLMILFVMMIIVTLPLFHS